MGKVGRILAVAVGVGLQLIPGAGNFVGGSILGSALASAGVYATTAFSIGMAAVGALSLYGIASAVSLVASIFAPGAPRPAAASRQERQPTPLRIYMAGRRRGYGVVVPFAG